MAKPKEKRRFFGLFPGRSNSFAPPARTDDGAMNAALLAGVIASDPGIVVDERERDSPSHYDHPVSNPLHTPTYQDSPSHYDYSGSSGSSGGYDSGSSSFDSGSSSGGDSGGGGGGD